MKKRLFSFNSLYGGCSICDGLGKKSDIDIKLIMPDENLSIADGALKPIGPINGCAIHPYSYIVEDTISALAKLYNFNLNQPWSELSQDAKTQFFLALVIRKLAIDLLQRRPFLA